MSSFLCGLEACAVQAQSLNERVHTYISTSHSVQTNIWDQPVQIFHFEKEQLSTVLNSQRSTSVILSSESLLYSIPYLHKLVSERVSKVIHVSAGVEARDTFAEFTQVMSLRQSGLALLSASSVQEAYDLAFLAQWASLLTSTPFLHFFDNKRISREYCTVELLKKEDSLKLLPNSPEMTEKCEVNSLGVFDTLCNVMAQFASVTGRRYTPLQYAGHPEAKFVIVALGAGASVAEKTLLAMLEADANLKFGLLKILLYRPWSEKHFLISTPSTVQRIAVLEPVSDYTSTWNPLFLDIAATYQTTNNDEIDLFSGIYGITEPDFSPDTVCAIYNGLVSNSLDRQFATSDLPISNCLFKLPLLATEQIIFVGNLSLARSFATSSTKNVQLYPVGEISHIRLATTEGPLLPSLITYADAVVLDPLPISPHNMSSALEAISTLKVGGFLIVDSSSDFELSLSPELKKAAYISQAKLLLIEDIHNSLIGSVSQVLSSPKCHFELIPAEWNLLAKTSPTVQISSNDHQEGVFGTTSNVMRVEVPYLKALELVFGSRLNVANASRSASVWFSNESYVSVATSEFGYGRLLSQIQERARFVDSVINIIRASSSFPSDAIRVLSRWLMLVNSPQSSPERINESADVVIQVMSSFPTLIEKKELLYESSNWLIGSDTWARDLGQSGFHHVIKSGENVNILIIDTNPYSNHVDKEQRKKDLGLYAMNYGSVYVASVAIYSSYTGVLNALMEADAYKGPSVVIGYMPQFGATPNPLESLKETKICVDNGSWPLYRWNPGLEKIGKEIFTLDSLRIKRSLEEFLSQENHLTQVISQQIDTSSVLTSSLEKDIEKCHLELKCKARTDYARSLAGLGTSLNTGQSLTVLFGSDNGNGEGVARRIATGAKSRGILVKLMAMDDYEDVKGLSEESNVVIVCSTAGQGEMPTNARKFWKAFNGLLKGEINLSEVNVGVFGLGDSHYWSREEDALFYNRPSRMLDAKFDNLGASKLIRLGLGDDQDEDGFETGFSCWVLELWKALGVQNIQEKIDIYTDEQMKIDSNYLRGSIAQDLVDDSTGSVSEISEKLLQFHGVYLQDDRDLRDGRTKQGLEKAYSFMVQVRTPGGIATPKQWLAIDNLSTKFGDKTIKLTAHQTIQLHGIPKKKLRTTIRGISKTHLTTLGAGGDVIRNIMSTSITETPEVHGQIQAIVLRLAESLAPKTTAYHEIWLDNSMVAVKTVQDFEPVYGPSYLPQKFSIAVAVPPSNDVDVYAHDLGYIAIVDPIRKEVIGYNVMIGGGMDYEPGSKRTYPQVATLIGYIPAHAIISFTEAVVLIQSDHGNRVERARANFKYTIETLGIDFIKGEIEQRSGQRLEKPRQFYFNDNVDQYGWTKGAGDTWNFGMYIENGRVKDTPEFMCKSGLRDLAKFHKGDFRLTPNQHLVICNVPEVDLEKTKAHLAKYKLDNLSFSGIRKTSMACVGLPTCGQAMAESERYLPDLITLVDQMMEENGLRNDSIVVRMSGCPNGCVRSHLAELALVGQSPNTYNMYLGGSSKGDRLNKLYKENLKEESILQQLRPMIKKYALERNDNESFGDWVIRAGYIKKTYSGLDFHIR